MDRRTFIGRVAGGLLSVPLSTEAQQAPRLPRIGVLLAARTGPGASAGADELRSHVKSKLANYKVPREIVIHDELPRNETGKVLKRELKDEG